MKVDDNKWALLYPPTQYEIGRAFSDSRTTITKCGECELFLEDINTSKKLCTSVTLYYIQMHNTVYCYFYEDKRTCHFCAS